MGIKQLSEEKIEEIRRLRERGLTYSEIAEQAGCSEFAAYTYAYDVMNCDARKGEQKHDTAAVRRRLFARLAQIRKAVREGRSLLTGRELRPCEHCQWRTGKYDVSVCGVCYREVFSKQRAGAAVVQQSGPAR